MTPPLNVLRKWKICKKGMSSLSSVPKIQATGQDWSPSWDVRGSTRQAAEKEAAWLTGRGTEQRGTTKGSVRRQLCWDSLTLETFDPVELSGVMTKLEENGVPGRPAGKERLTEQLLTRLDHPVLRAVNRTLFGEHFRLSMSI